ncbi:MAG: hypothetical protein JSV17_11045 [Candidatus Aminicenantes bacterium]|nr:MAG: hypothetical protein JSV17_11045 [Candidatus Aminicenantes bacterium]
MPTDPHDILKDYLSVLEKREKYGMAMPLSMLPYTKTEIKDAIKSVISSTQNMEERDKLKKGFITLSEFIPDEVLKRVNQDWRDVADAECEVGQESEVVVETDIMAEVVEVQKSIADEGAQLAKEIIEFVSKISLV